MPVVKVKEKFRFFSILFLYCIFNTERKCVLTVFKAVNPKTINYECLAPQDMREGRVLSVTYFHKMCRLSSIVTEVNHNSAVGALFVYSGLVSRHNKSLKIEFPLTLMVYQIKISTFIKKQNPMANWASI